MESLLAALILLANGVAVVIFGLAFLFGAGTEKRYFAAGFGMIMAVFGMMQTVLTGYTIYHLFLGGI